MWGRVLGRLGKSEQSSNMANTPKRQHGFHAGHIIGLHMVIELAKTVAPTGDARADSNIRNAIARVKEIQQWLKPQIVWAPVDSAEQAGGADVGADLKGGDREI